MTKNVNQVYNIIILKEKRRRVAEIITRIALITDIIANTIAIYKAIIKATKTEDEDQK